MDNKQDLQEPIFVCKTQYVKDLSFENPRPLENLQTPKKDSDIEISVNVNAQPLETKNHYEVLLHIRATAQKNDKAAFLVDLVYGGIFETNVEPKNLQPLLLIECPRLLFPFARNIVSDMTTQGGYPALLLQPIDFHHLYNKKMHELRNKEEQEKKATQESSDAPKKANLH